jgi:hypothetical protein
VNHYQIFKWTVGRRVVWWNILVYKKSDSTDRYLGFGEIESDSQCQDLKIEEANFFQVQPCYLIE